MKFRSSAHWELGLLGAIVTIGLLARVALSVLHPARPATSAGVAEVPTPEAARQPITPTLPSLPEVPSAPSEPPVVSLPPGPKPPKSVWNTPLPSTMMTAPILKVDVGALPSEQAMLAIMRAPGPDDGKAEAHFAMLPHVPEETLSNVTEQAVKWLPDRNYAAVAYPIITNPATHAQVLGVMFADLMERPDAVTLPTLLKIAETPDHPFAPSAHDNLTLLVGRDLGVDWPAWKDVVFQRMSAGGP